MNRAARRHLLAYLDALTAPLYVFTVDGSAAPAPTLTKGLGRGNWLILPFAYDVEIVPPRSGVRVVSGKGARRRWLSKIELSAAPA